MEIADAKVGNKMAKDFLIAIDTNVLLILSKNQDKRRKYISTLATYLV